MRAILSAIWLTTATTPVWAAGDLLVAPTRVVLDNARGTEVILNNIGAEPATYRVSLELRRMDEAGRLHEVPEGRATAAETAALSMISYAPRRVVLPPNQPQAIRIGIRASQGLPDGEYRAHMLFRAVPEAVPAPSAPARGVAIALTPIYGVTIPIIIRQGAMSSSATIDNVRRCRQGADGGVASSGQPAFCFDLSRSGSGSTYGRVRVTKAGAKAPLLDVRGIAIYPELQRRTVVLPLQEAAAAALHGTLKVEYLADSETASGSIATFEGSVG